MISPTKMRELISSKKDIYVLYWFCLNKNLRITIITLNENFRVVKDKLYYKDNCVNDLNMCFEDLDLKYQRMNGVVEDCSFMYSYESLEDDLM